MRPAKEEAQATVAIGERTYENLYKGERWKQRHGLGIKITINRRK